MRTLTKILALVAAVGLCAGGAQAAFDFTDTGNSPRQVQIDEEGWRDLTCVNLFNNPPGFLPPYPDPPCVLVPPFSGCPNHPNIRAADPTCTVYVNSTPSSSGPFFYPDPPGVPSNDYFAAATYVGTGPCTSPGSCIWNIRVPEEVWGQVAQRTLAKAGANINAIFQTLDMNVDFGTTGPGSVTPANPALGWFGSPEFYHGDAFYETAQADWMGVAAPENRDAPYFGQSQRPFVTTADPGAPIAFSCAASAVVTPPINLNPLPLPLGGGAYTENGGVGGAATFTLTDSTVTVGSNDFITIGSALPPQTLAVAGGTTARMTSGVSNGQVIDITGRTQTTLTLADAVTVSDDDTFVVEFFGTANGPPFPQGIIEGGHCPNTVGSLAGLPQELGYDLASSPGQTQLTAFVNAYTTLGTSPLTNPVWLPLDIRLEEVVDTDSDGIPDRHDNCTVVANGPLLGPASCYYPIDKSGNPVTVGPPYTTAVGFVQVDTDGDGHGDPCDGDFNHDGVLNSSDVVILNADLSTGTSTPGTGTDMNCDGVVNSTDQVLQNAQVIQSFPGPSGLWCAGTGTPAAPCLF